MTFFVYFVHFPTNVCWLTHQSQVLISRTLSDLIIIFTVTINRQPGWLINQVDHTTSHLRENSDLKNVSITSCVGLSSSVVGPNPNPNPLPTIGNSFKKHKSLYKLVLMPSIKPHIHSYGLMGDHDTIGVMVSKELTQYMQYCYCRAP